VSSRKTTEVMKNFFGGYKGGEKDPIVIVIDAGHGGRDPGKVGVNGALEKDINLSLAFKLKKFLELKGIKVVMTRENDVGLYSETDSNKKNADLKERINIIQKSNADFAISIHQNSFEQEEIKGAQVFYHEGSKEGKEMALIIQEQIKETIKDGNHRKAKSNNNYYMLKNTECPLVIVECGYMSNRKEAELLTSEDYQLKMAWAIYLGVINYINGLD
jgi:N-acetylmuramoyl-L-alanine amidase